MGIRRIINGKAYLARERDSTKGKKGTIMGKWSLKDSLRKAFKKKTSVKKKK